MFLSSKHFYGRFWVQAKTDQTIEPPDLPETLPGDLEDALRSYAKAQAGKVALFTGTAEDEALLTVRYLFYYDQHDTLRKRMQLDMAKEYAESILVSKGNRKSAQALGILSRLAIHPAVAVLSQNAVDEV